MASGKERSERKSPTHLPLLSDDGLRSRKNQAALEMNPSTSVFVFSVIVLLGSSASADDDKKVNRQANIHVFTPHGPSQTTEHFSGIYGARSLTNPVSGKTEASW